MPNRAKHMTLVQEVIRILRNTSKRLPDEIKHTALSTFSFRMKESGYGAEVRLRVLQDGCRAFEKQVQRDSEGSCPLYRPKGYQQDKKRRKKALSKVAWYRPQNTVLFIPPTPNSELKKRLQTVANKTAEESGLRVRIVERAGSRLQHMLPGLKSQKECEEQKCFLHSTGGRGNHEVEGVVYRGDCMTCEEEGPYSKPDSKGEVQPVQSRGPGFKL